VSGPAGAFGARSALAAERPAATASAVYYLALGDSVPMWNGPHSYPNLVTSHYRPSVPGLTLDNMACSGETTSSMINHSLCAPGGSQYRNAIAFLRRHLGKVALVTIDIGGNDVVYCMSASNPAVCFADGLKTMQKNLATILAGLRTATHGKVPIIGMNYYNPLLGDWLAGPGPYRTLTNEAIAGVATLNTDMEHVYAKAAVPVAHVATAYKSGDMTHYVSSSWGRIPVAVDRACMLLDITCHRNAPEGFGDDPNNPGAVVIAHTFEHAIGSLRPPN
jgi:lysophospholipase L1-like esterase